MYNVDRVIEVFLKHPHNSTDQQGWFDKITKILVPNVIERPIHARPQVGSVKPLLRGNLELPVTFNHVKVYSFNSLFPSLISTWTDEFTIPDYQSYHRAIYGARERCKVQGLRDVASDIKRYMNMIYGQLCDGSIRHQYRTQADVIADARAIQQHIFSMHTCLYADVDTFVLTQYDEHECAHVDGATLSTTGWLLSGNLEDYSKVTVNAKCELRCYK